MATDLMENCNKITLSIHTNSQNTLLHAKAESQISDVSNFR